MDKSFISMKSGRGHAFESTGGGGRFDGTPTASGSRVTRVWTRVHGAGEVLPNPNCHEIVGNPDGKLDGFEHNKRELLSRSSRKSETSKDLRGETSATSNSPNISTGPPVNNIFSASSLYQSMTAKLLSGATTIPIGSISSTPNDPISNAATQLFNVPSSNGLIFSAHVPSYPITFQQNKTPAHETLDVFHPDDGTTNLIFSANNDSSDRTKKSSKKWKMLARSKTTNKTRSKVADVERRRKRDTTNDFEEEKKQRTILGEISNLLGSAATA
ncbi:hypothetical protein PanWU01x14_038690 [Parasponia andersonii]|uniref:Uncharacterized protein n=1 Tax=Parasponia andersonii TaxID=3476 RepID=A0A2P5DRK5_PARAD|nr:hypothetical protein PanWU01x14_038690 [Parasponia andersonii]